MVDDLDKNECLQELVVGGDSLAASLIYLWLKDCRECKVYAVGMHAVKLSYNISLYKTLV